MSSLPCVTIKVDGQIRWDFGHQWTWADDDATTPYHIRARYCEKCYEERHHENRPPREGNREPS